MKKKVFLTLLTAASIASFTSCSKDEVNIGGGEKSSNAVTINGGITRAVDSDWEAGDAIGLTMYNSDYSEQIDGIYNKRYTTPTGDGTFNAATPSDTLYFPQNGSSVKFVSYYPYTASLNNDMLLHWSVLDQSILQNIDLMTAEHMNGFSKTDPDVQLHFHHRLSKLIFILDVQDDGDFVSLEDCDLTLKGMVTGKTYDLVNDVFTSQSDGIADISVDRRTGENANYRQAIVLPREANEGVIFEFSTPTGDTYLAYMHDTLSLDRGNQYTFLITLSKNPVTVSATIEPWIPRGPYEYGTLRVGTPADASSGVNIDDVMNVYLQEEGGTDFSLLREFTYTAPNTWTPSTPVYWEDINQDPATFRASIIQEEALNTTQLPDILIADEETVNRHDPVNFTLRHAASKVTVTLSSSTFSDNDIQNATITLSQYEIGGQEQNGEFIPGTQTGDILVERTNANSGVALFQPQTIAANNPIVSLDINGRPYNAYDQNGFTFEAGVAYQININVYKEEVTFSATVVDWLADTLNLDAITIGTAVSGGTNIWDREELLIYTGDDTDRTYLNTYIYDSISNVFSSITPTYWESLDDPTTFYGYIERHPAYAANQIPDWIVADPETVSASNGINLTLSHVAAQIVVQLTSDDNTFSDAELAAMDITLPNYYIGATMDNGVFVPGSQTGNVTVAKNVGENNNSAIALIQPQQRTTGSTVVQLNSTNREYNATYNQNIDFAAGTTTLLIIDLSKTEITMSATVIDWEDAGEYPLTVEAIQIGGSLGTNDGFFTDKSITIYKLGNLIEDYIYSYDGSIWTGPTLYWDDMSLPFTLSAVYSPNDNHILTADSIPWSIATDQNQSANGYYANYDLLADTLQFTSPRYANFEFKHVLSKVTIELKPGTGFVAADLVGTTVVLNDFMVNGSLNINTGAIQNPYNYQDIEPWVETDGVTYSALVMPEQKTNGTDILTITVPGYPTTPFTGTLSQNINFAAGKEVVITVTLNKTLIQLSATVKDWESGDTGNIIIQ